MRKKLAQFAGFFLLRASLVLVLAVLLLLLYDIGAKGGGAISWEFLTRRPRHGMTEGGIFPAIFGTFLVTVITAALAVPLGVFAAIYLNEYARTGRSSRGSSGCRSGTFRGSRPSSTGSSGSSSS